MIFGTSMAILTSVFQTGKGKGNRNKYHSDISWIFSRACYRGLLTHYLGWRSIFAFLVPFGIISLILIQRKIKIEWAEAVGEKFDWRGSIIYGIALASFMWGFSKLPSPLG